MSCRPMATTPTPRPADTHARAASGSALARDCSTTSATRAKSGTAANSTTVNPLGGSWVVNSAAT